MDRFELGRKWQGGSVDYEVAVGQEFWFSFHFDPCYSLMSASEITFEKYLGWLIQPHWVMDLSLSQWSAWLAKLDHLDWVTRRASVQLCVWESKIFKICADLRKLGGKNLVNNNLFRIKEGEFLYFPPLYCSELLTAVFYIELKKERF